jgi:hypothetical protein
VVLPTICHVEKHVCLSHDVYVIGAAWQTTMRIETGQVLDGRMIERSGDDVCGLHHAQGDEEHGFLGSALKPRSMVSTGLASK